MKNMIIKFVKKHRSLYNLAKKVNRKLNRVQVSKCMDSNIIFYAYIMKENKELELIKKHYLKNKRYNSKLLIIIDNYECSKNIHKYIRNNIGIYFASMDFYRTYNKKIDVNKLVFLDYKDSNEKILNYIK